MSSHQDITLINWIMVFVTFSHSLFAQGGGGRGRRQEEAAAADSFLNRLSFVAENEEVNSENKVSMKLPME